MISNPLKKMDGCRSRSCQSNKSRLHKLTQFRRQTLLLIRFLNRRSNPSSRPSMQPSSDCKWLRASNGPSPPATSLMAPKEPDTNSSSALARRAAPSRASPDPNDQLLLCAKALDTSDHLPALGGLTTTCRSRASMDDCRTQTVSSLTSASIASGLGCAPPQPRSSLVVSRAAAPAHLPDSRLIALATFFSGTAHASAALALTLAAAASTPPRRGAPWLLFAARRCLRRSERRSRTCSLASARPSRAAPHRSSSVTDASSSPSTSRRCRGRRSASQLVGRRTTSSTYSCRSLRSWSRARRACAGGGGDTETQQDLRRCSSCSALRTRECGRVGKLMDRRWAAMDRNRNVGWV